MSKFNIYLLFLVSLATLNIQGVEEDKPNHEKHRLEKYQPQSLKLICAKAILQNSSDDKPEEKLNIDCLDYVKAVKAIDIHISKLQEIIATVTPKDGDYCPVDNLISYHEVQNAKQDPSLMNYHKSLLYGLIDSATFTDNSKTIIAILKNCSIINLCYNSTESFDIDTLNFLVNILANPKTSNHDDEELKTTLQKIACTAIKEDLDLCRLLAYHQLLPKLEDDMYERPTVTFFMQALENCTNPETLNFLIDQALPEDPKSFWDHMFNRKAQNIQNNMSIFHYAALGNNVGTIIDLAKSHNIDITDLIDELDSNGETPLMIAIRSHHEEAVEHLIQNGANVNLILRYGTLLSYAQEISQRLLQAKTPRWNTSPEEFEQIKQRAQSIVTLIENKIRESSILFNRCIMM